MKTVHVTGVGIDPTSDEKAMMKFEVEAENQGDLIKKTLEGYKELGGLVYMVHIPLFNFEEKGEE